MKYDTQYHKPIMVEEIQQLLNLKSDGIYLDGTLGGGGHSEMILEMSSPNGRLIGIDKDDDAHKFAAERLSRFGERFTPVKSDYLYASKVIEDLGVEGLDGALLDLGVSSFQLDNFERGFSYRNDDAELDMRMDKTQSFSAKDVVNDYSFEELRKIFYEYGEDKYSSRIASNIEKYRQDQPIVTCGQLVEIIKKSVPAKVKREGGHPAKKIFQAIRIEVNGEIKDLEEAVTNLVRKLKVGGRLCVITFHSLEDRIVKNVFRELEKDCVCSKALPICVCNKVREVKVLTRKPMTATAEECAQNSRSTSAKLRAVEKV